MECCQAVDSILDLLTSSPQLTANSLAEWICLNGGNECLEQRDSFGVSVRCILLDWGLSNKLIVGACELASKREQFHTDRASGGIPTTAEKAEEEKEEEADEDLDASKSTDDSSGVNKPDAPILIVSESLLSATPGSELASSVPVPPAVEPKRSPFLPKPLCTLSSALVQRLDRHPCARCFGPEFLESLSALCLGLPQPTSSSLSLSSSGGGADSSTTTNVTSLLGVVGWWVQKIELRTLTTKWVAKKIGRGGGCRNNSNSNNGGGVGFELKQEQRCAWYGDEAYCSAAKLQRQGSVSEPLLELIPGECVVKVEQFITPRSREERRAQVGLFFC